MITSRFAKNWGQWRCYVIVGLGLSFVQNLRGLLTGGPSAFAWTGSLVDQGRLVWWWFESQRHPSGCGSGLWWSEVVLADTMVDRIADPAPFRVRYEIRAGLETRGRR